MNTTNSAPVPTFAPYRPAYSTKRTNPVYSASAYKAQERS